MDVKYVAPLIKALLAAQSPSQAMGAEPRKTGPEGGADQAAGMETGVEEGGAGLAGSEAYKTGTGADAGAESVGKAGAGAGGESRPEGGGAEGSMGAQQLLRLMGHQPTGGGGMGRGLLGVGVAAAWGHKDVRALLEQEVRDEGVYRAGNVKSYLILWRIT